MVSHSERCWCESTRDVIFLLQTRQRDVVGLPEGIEPDDDYGFQRVRDEDGNELNEPVDVSLDELSKMIFGEYDVPCVIEHWLTKSVWLDRDEAEKYAESRSYEYGTNGSGWRVYGVCANGELAQLLRSQDNAKGGE